jgi:hypothetical protein
VILLQTYLHTHTLLREVASEVLPLSSYALSPAMLPLLETFLELLSVLSSHFLDTFNILKYSSLLRKTIFRNSHKSFGAKSGEENGCSISETDFWTRNCLTHKFFYARLHITPSVFPYNKLGWLYGLVEWNQSEECPWYRSDEQSLHVWFRHASSLNRISNSKS